MYVKDAAKAIVRAAEKEGNGGGERYLVGDQRLVTNEFYDLIAEISGTPRPRFEVTFYYWLKPDPNPTAIPTLPLPLPLPLLLPLPPVLRCRLGWH